MWKKEEGKSQGVAEKSAAASEVSATAPAPGLSTPRDSNAAAPASARGTATIGKGIRIKGEVSGNEDLFVDGSVEGKLNLSDDCCVTIGPNGEIKADICAREVVVRGRVDGRIVGREKIQLGSSANISGDLKTERLTIEDGAILRGRVEIETGKPIEIRGEARSAAAGASGKPSASIGPSSAAAN
jgi:cytoskeletal protein CcmA (bactofilin family)